MPSRSSPRELFFELSVDMLCIADEAGSFIDVNEAWTTTTGWSTEELRSGPFIEFVHPDDVKATIHEAMALNERRETVHFQNRYRCKDGRYIWLSWKSISKDIDGRSLIFAVAHDITEQKRLEDALRHLADHDGLTGLWSRRRFEQEVDKQVARCKRYGEVASLFLLDLDRFKMVNDQHGHAAGDGLLKHVSACLRERLRASDSIARLGGDEFAVLLPNLQPDDAALTAEAVAEHLRDTPFAFDGVEIPIAASTGIAFLDRDATSGDDAMLAADRAMYDTKASGRNAVSGLRRPGEETVRETRVYHCDDSEAYRRLLAEMLGAHPDITTVGGADTLADGLADIQETRPDVVLLDALMGAEDLTSGIADLRAAAPAAAVLVLSGLPACPEGLRELVDGFVSKRSTFDDIADATRLVAAVPVRG